MTDAAPIITGPFQLFKGYPGLVPCGIPGCGKPADLLAFEGTRRGKVIPLFRVICSGFDCWCANQSQTRYRQEEAEGEWNRKNAPKEGK